MPRGDWDFARFTAAFGAAAPVVPPSPPPPGACAAPAWSASAVYVGGSLVTYESHTWEAKWWTHGETPGAADVWADQGPCV